MKSNYKLFNTFNSVKSLKLIIAFLFGFIIHDTFIRRSISMRYDSSGDINQKMLIFFRLSLNINPFLKPSLLLLNI